jgi:AcrR family transcriptional regulator
MTTVTSRAGHSREGSKATQHQSSTAPRARSEATREDLVAAAKEMFREQGFDNASMESLAVAVGIGESELLRHFGSKEELLAAVLEAGDGRSETESPRKREGNMKAKVLSAARDLFHERGFHAVSIDAIGSKVGITGPGVYRHYGSKEELLMAVLEDGLQQSLKARKGSQSEPLDLEQLVRAHVDYNMDHPEVMSIWYMEARHLPEQIRHDVGIAQRKFMEGFIAALLEREPQLDPDEAKLMVVAMLGMVGHTAIYYPRHLPNEREREVLVRMALQSVGVRSDA